MEVDGRSHNKLNPVSCSLSCDRCAFVRQRRDGWSAKRSTPKSGLRRRSTQEDAKYSSRSGAQRLQAGANGYGAGAKEALANANAKGDHLRKSRSVTKAPVKPGLRDFRTNLCSRPEPRPLMQCRRLRLDRASRGRQLQAVVQLRFSNAMCRESMPPVWRRGRCLFDLQSDHPQVPRYERGDWLFLKSESERL